MIHSFHDGIGDGLDDGLDDGLEDGLVRAIALHHYRKQPSQPSQLRRVRSFHEFHRLHWQTNRAFQQAKTLRLLEPRVCKAQIGQKMRQQIGLKLFFTMLLTPGSASIR